jgi:hypothetical protein
VSTPLPPPPPVLTAPPPAPCNSYFDALCSAVQHAKHSVWLETCATASNYNRFPPLN